MVLQDLYRTIYPQDMPFRALMFHVRPGGVPEMGTVQGLVFDGLEIVALQSLGRERI